MKNFKIYTIENNTIKETRITCKSMAEIYLQPDKYKNIIEIQEDQEEK